MQSGKIISLSVWLMISFNLLLAVVAVWSFQRMSPEIKQVYEHNVVSLEACENMTLALMMGEKPDHDKFLAALTAAENNITETGEQETLARIRTAFIYLPAGDMTARQEIAKEIQKLSDCNRQAVVASAEKTQRMRQAGAWGIVFMTFFFFTAALLFEHRLRKSFLLPLQEMDTVLKEHRMGDKFRRCNDAAASADMKRLFKAINALLDGKKEK